MSAEETVVITGAGGFIGSHLVERCVQEGFRVRAFVRYNSRNEVGALGWAPREVLDEVEIVLGDLRDVESVERLIAGASHVLHLAAQIAIPYSYQNPRDFFETNVLGSLNVAQSALRAGVRRVVHTSTSEVYGTAQVAPITEAHPLNPQSPYAASKLAADKLMDSFHRSFELATVVLRPFNTFGPRQSARAIIPTIITQALSGDVLQLGSLDPRRDMTYVSDTAEGMLLAMQREAAVGETIQLGTGRDVTVGEIVEMVQRLLGRELRVELDAARVRPAASEVMRLISGPERAAEVLGWRPQVSLEEGLRSTIDYIAEHLDRYRGGYVI